MKPVYPRFRTLHDAGKYLSAQLYTEARKLTPEDFGAVPRYVENPLYKAAIFQAVLNEHYPALSYILTENDEDAPEGCCWEDKTPCACKQTGVPYGTPAPEVERNTAHQWYLMYPEPTILFADGFLKAGQQFDELFFHKLITREEFEAMRGNSYCDQ